MNNPFFSIIIPTFNRALLIEKTIRSVLEQTYNDFELIVVDDGSTDNTKEIIDEINDPRLIYHFKKNEERSAARNFGIKKSRGKYVSFLDSDDYFLPNHLDEAHKFIQKKCPIIFHQQYQIKKGNKIRKAIIKTSIRQALIDGNPLSCMGVFIMKELALKNLFKEGKWINISEDYELWLRYAAKHTFLYNPVCTSTLIVHDSRSVFNIDINNLIKCKVGMLDIAFKDKDVTRVYDKHRNTMYANAYSYISLHIALSKKHKIESFQYLLKSIYTKPNTIFQKRNFAILKHLLR